MRSRGLRVLAATVVCLLAACGGEPSHHVAPEAPSANAAPSGQPENADAEPTVPPERAAVGPVVTIERERVTLEGLMVGSVAAIDGLGRMQKLDELFEQLKARRAEWKAAHPLEPFPGVASLVVAPSTSSVVLASAYQTMAYAGFPIIDVAVGDRFWRTHAAIPGPPCGVGVDVCIERPARTVLHLQGDEGGWRVMIPQQDAPLEESGASSSGVDAALTRLIASAQVAALVVHLPEAATFEAMAPYLVAAVQANERAQLEVPPTLSIRDLSGVSTKAAAPARATTSAAGGSAVVGRLPPEVIQRIVRASFGELRKCYEQALAKDPNATGRTVAQFVIGRDGHVEKVSTTTEGSLPPEVGTCVEKLVSTLTFPAPEGGIVKVSYPFVFTPGG